MQRDVIAREFVKIFQERAGGEIKMVRAEREGRIDPRRAARVVNGDDRIFMARRMTQGIRAAGSFALCVTLEDVFHWYTETQASWGGPWDPELKAQVRMWESAVRCLFDAARSAGIPCRIFAAGADRAWAFGPDSPTDLREFDSVEALLAPQNALNVWTRQKETVVRAEQWHRAVNPTGRRVTLLVTMWPEIRYPQANRDPALYEKHVAEIAEETARWTRGSNFYAVGIQLELTSRATWGEYQRRGVHNHFRACFPSAARYEVNEADDLVLVVRALARKMAKLQR